MARSVRRSVVLRRRFVVHDDANLGGASKLGPLEHLELGRRSGPTGTSGEGTCRSVASPTSCWRTATRAIATGWSGHPEVIWPTIASLRLEDIGSNGSF